MSEEGLKIILENPGHTRRVHLKHGVFIEHGLWESCPGCRAMKLGLRAQGHSPACRARMEDALGWSGWTSPWTRTKDVIGERATKRAMLGLLQAGRRGGDAES